MLTKKSNLIKRLIASKESLHKPLFVHKSTFIPSKNVFNLLMDSGLIDKIGEGLYCFSGIANELIEQFDTVFKNVSNVFNGKEIAYPATVSPKVLSKAGYFKNFSNIVQFISCMKKRELNNFKFTKNQLYKYCRSGNLITKNMLLPAACLPCYSQLSRHNLDTDLLTITTRNKIFRNDWVYNNIFKMSEFDMRELVFIGKKKSVSDALNRCTEIVKSLARDLNFTFTLDVSSDFFYGNDSQLKSLFQLLTKSKIELRAFSYDFKKYIPIASINFHDTHFSKAFRIQIEDKCAYTGCVAFGLQRWVLIFLNMYGINKKFWPQKIQNILKQENRHQR